MTASSNSIFYFYGQFFWVQMMFSPLLQTFLRVRANRHTRLNGTLIHVDRMLCFCAAHSVCGSESRPGDCHAVKLRRWKRYFVHARRPHPHQSFRYHLFSHTISAGLAPPRAEELLTFKLWPLDMLTVDDLCWCRCYVKSAPLRPHSAGAHLDCAQAGKKHWEAFFTEDSTHTQETFILFISTFSYFIKDPPLTLVHQLTNQSVFI